MHFQLIQIKSVLSIQIRSITPNQNWCMLVICPITYRTLPADGVLLVDADGVLLVDADGRLLVDADGVLLVDANGVLLVDADGRLLVDAVA